MTMTPQRSADGPSIPVGGPSSFQLELVPPLELTDALYGIHEAGHTLAAVVAAWTWLEGQADAAGE